MSTYQNIEDFPTPNSEDMDEEEKKRRKEKDMQDARKKAALSEETLKKASADDEPSKPMTDISGEEKKEDYINTDERLKDFRRKGL